MDCKELRIGNLIIAKTDIVSYIVEVISIDAEGCKAKTLDGNVPGLVHHEIEPIPLTEEWLVKFGFEDKGRVNGILQKKSSNPRREVGLFDLYEDGRCWSVMFQEDVGCGFSDLNEIEYVHQLQNLYFALTGEELEYV